VDRKIVVSSLIWRFAERCGAQGVSFIVGLVLARLLAPEDYGLIAIVSVFTTFLDIFIDGGFAGALVQKKDADDLDYSSVLSLY
jgi:O-antigen/teichoic acid export membrane protein